jgi:hypothetical protein
MHSDVKIMQFSAFSFIFMITQTVAAICDTFRDMYPKILEQLIGRRTSISFLANMDTLMKENMATNWWTWKLIVISI